MLKIRDSRILGGSVAIGTLAVIAGAQALPCWKTFPTTRTACSEWLSQNPLVACWTGFTLDQPVYVANRAASPWSEPIVQYAECAGPYKILDEKNNCVVEMTLSGWQTTGTQGGGDPCPSGGGGS